MKRFGFLSVFAGWMLLAPASVWAEEAKTLPQLEASLYPEQLFWLTLCFPLLYVLMRWLAVPAVQRVQNARHEVLRADLDAAAEASEAAKVLQARYEKALADARAKAQATVNEIVASAMEEAAARQAGQQEALEKRVAEAEEKIAAMRDSAFREVQSAAVDLAGAVVEKLTGLKGSSVMRGGR